MDSLPIRTYDDDGNIKIESWCKNEETEFHRLDGPAQIIYYSNGNIKFSSWHKHNMLYCLSEPAYVEYDVDGNIVLERWYINGKRIKDPPKPWPLTKEQQVELKLKYG